MSTKVKYVGRYTVREYSLGKQALIRAHPESPHAFIETVCRYIAKKDWPQEREETYKYLKNFGRHSGASIEMLSIYDEAQQTLDWIHHGITFIRFYEKIEGVPESDQEFETSLVISAIQGGTYTGPVPTQFLDHLK